MRGRRLFPSTFLRSERATPVERYSAPVHLFRSAIRAESPRPKSGLESLGETTLGVVAFNNVESAVLAKSKKVTFVEQLAREQSEYFR